MTTITVDQTQLRVDPDEAREAVRRVQGVDSVTAVARLRYGPGRTCEPVARLIDQAVGRARQHGLDPRRLTVTSVRIEAGEDIVRVRRKAHGTADWITSCTSDVLVELTPDGINQATNRAMPQPAGQPAHDTAGPNSIDDEATAYIRERLFEVIDPDLGVNVVDLGFVRAIQLDDRTVALTMTLTSAACPLTGVMTDQIHTELTTHGLADDVRIEWQWTPAWSPADITPDGRAQLRAIGFTI
ncbi:iron-sulfur cluster assembly protein [Kribbella sp. NPDC059898]|uniref:iron-sulfur cluster assembly protein n=1 Tax=Kribbella sp. NPDC059898 TaxID=3346995 RepID=UPI0036533208